MRQWLRRRNGYRALVQLATAPRSELAARVGQDGRGIDHVHRMLRESIQEEHTAEGALRRTRMVLEHLQQDRDLMAEALMVASAEVRRHQDLAFDGELMNWT